MKGNGNIKMYKSVKNAKDSRDGSADPVRQAVTRKFGIVVLLHRDAYENMVKDLGDIKGGADESSGVAEPSHGPTWLIHSIIRLEKGEFEH